MRKYLLMFALLTLTLAACRVESNVTLTIREDGSATVVTEIGFDDEFRNIIEGIGVVPEDILSDLPTLTNGDGVPFQRTEGDLTFFGVTSEIEDLSTFELGSDGLDAFTNFSYEFDGTTAQLDATLNADGLGGDSENLPIDPSQISADLVSASVIIVMPGQIKEHNADEVRADGTLVWDVSLTGSTSISAISDFGSTATSWIWWPIAAVVVLSIVGVGIALRGSRKKEKAAVAAAAAAHESDAIDSDIGPSELDQPETT